MSESDRTQEFFQAIAGLDDGMLELRYRRTAGGMGQCFFDTAQLEQAATFARNMGLRTDVYFGVAPRCTHEGGRSAITTALAVWADCDDATASVAARRAPLPPSAIVASGTPNACHAYWLLSVPAGAEIVEQLNRRLALALGADGRCAEAARILRVPGTRNFKRDPSAPVELVAFNPSRRYRPAELDAWLPEEPQGAPPDAVATRSRRFTSDPLRSVTPAAYARVLLGVAVDRSRKIRCPFHDDRTPSLHLYPTAEEGWYCFGCGRGSTIYDMAAALWRMGTRGSDFLELRARLLAAFGMEEPQRVRS